ncbi:murein biosynthesis integral membrane protein MurJ [Microlunatus speluncae]|uniref:murein biosynthesis integral membrane protein MurJ n=1 Tax=Microlunatus speluncae TaxID=2594267 RepID=UPI0012662134|nr:murein biosynthesis integral membrane protein MurJ [Microlunatus speluncae]
MNPARSSTTAPSKTSGTASRRSPDPSRRNRSRLVSATVLMAGGTAVSRLLGFGRFALLVALFGNATQQADMFNYANTVPTSMYILLAGGILNTVLVPQIVRAIRQDPDGGEAYTNRIMTLGILVLGLLTVVLTVAAPLVIWIYTPESWHTPELSRAYDSTVRLAYYCMPQIFFYGIHVLAGQVLNARDKFGPMMWSPIANNIISIGVLSIFFVVFGTGDGVGAFTAQQELLLGLGSTLGIVAQAAVLVPYLKSIGYQFRPRFDFKGTGLGRTVRLAKWTLGFVLVNQAALVVIQKVAGGATAEGSGGGLTVYMYAFAAYQLPHSLIAVSLATAMLPSASRLVAAGDLAGVRDETIGTMRLLLTAMVPAAVALFSLGVPMAEFVFGFGRGVDDAYLTGWTLMAFAFGLIPFTLHYLCLRTYYALEDNRTAFLIQIAIGAANASLAVLIVLLLNSPATTAVGLAIAHVISYSIGLVLAVAILSRRLPGMPVGGLVGHGLKLLLAVAPAGGAAYGVTAAFKLWSSAKLVQLLALAVAGVVAIVIFLLLARLLRISEVSQILAFVLRRRQPAPAPIEDEASIQTVIRPLREFYGETGMPEPRIDQGRQQPRIDPDAKHHRITAVRSFSTGGRISTMSAKPGSEMTTPSPPSADTPDQPGPAESPSAALATPPGGPGPAASITSPGTVLADRYRLEEMLAADDPTITWRAFDQVLSRSVSVHLLPPRDPHATEVLDAARRGAAATDSRFLRVLDAVYSDDPRIGSYIVCEYATGQPLSAILAQGPLSGLEAAWVTREVADALSAVHGFGLFHERISPETVVVTPTGNVKIVGLVIEAALRPARGGEPEGHGERADVHDLGRLLYASLVSRWPGGPAYGLGPAPVLGGRWATPRQVRAGVSPALDTVCDQILGRPPRHHAPSITTANEVVNALTKVLGTADATGDLERRLRQPIPRVTPDETGEIPLSEQPTGMMAAVDRPGSPDTNPTEDQPRVAGSPALPMAGSISPSSPESARSTMIRQPPPPNGATALIPAVRNGNGAPSKPQRWIVLLVALVVLLVIGAIVGSLVIRPSGLPLPGPNPPNSSAPPTEEPPADPVKVPIRDGRDFDPQGDPSEENGDEVPNAFDGDPETRWRTVQYRNNPELGGLKRGVGIVFDLGEPVPVRELKLILTGEGTDLDIRVPEDDPAGTVDPPMNSDRDWRVVGKVTDAGETADVTLAEPVTTRYVLVFLTSLPQEEPRRFRGGIHEVEVYR